MMQRCHSIIPRLNCPGLDCLMMPWCHGASGGSKSRKGTGRIVRPGRGVLLLPYSLRSLWAGSLWHHLIHYPLFLSLFLFLFLSSSFFSPSLFHSSIILLFLPPFIFIHLPPSFHLSLSLSLHLSSPSHSPPLFCISAATLFFHPLPCLLQWVWVALPI